MNESNYLGAERALAKTLRRHFPQKRYPGFSHDDVRKEAKDLVAYRDLAKATQAIEHSKRNPDNDKKDLSKIENNLRLAAEGVETLGWHGKRALGKAFADSPSARGGVEWRGAFHLMQDDFACHLRSLIGVLKEARQQADAVSYADEANFRTTKGKKDAELGFAKKCAQVVERVTGKGLTAEDSLPGWRGDGRQAIFREFLRDAFKAVGITASSVSVADKYIRQERGSG